MFDKSSIYNLIERLPIKGQSQATMNSLYRNKGNFERSRYFVTDGYIYRVR